MILSLLEAKLLRASYRKSKTGTFFIKDDDILLLYDMICEYADILDKNSIEIKRLKENNLKDVWFII